MGLRYLHPKKCWQLDGAPGREMMHARHSFVNLVIGLPLFMVAGNADAQSAAATDAEYTATVMTAAPPPIC
jgi:hypothetical protein